MGQRAARKTEEASFPQRTNGEVRTLTPLLIAPVEQPGTQHEDDCAEHRRLPLPDGEVMPRVRANQDTEPDRRLQRSSNDVMLLALGWGKERVSVGPGLSTAPVLRPTHRIRHSFGNGEADVEKNVGRRQEGQDHECPGHRLPLTVWGRQTGLSAVRDRRQEQQGDQGPRFSNAADDRNAAAPVWTELYRQKEESEVYPVHVPAAQQ